MSRKKNIFTVTTITGAGFNSRCVGWFPTFGEAEISVINNDLDIWEGDYTYVIIEEVPPGLYNWCDYKKPIWYRYNKKSKKYKPCRTPKKYRNTVGWGIG